MKNMAVGLIILMVVVIATVVFIDKVKADENYMNDMKKMETDGIVYDVEPEEVCEWLKEWIGSVGDGRAYESFEDGYYKGYGIVVGKTFEEEFGMLPTYENIQKVYDKVIGGEEYQGKATVTTAGFYEDYTVYIVKAETTVKPLGEYYIPEEGWVDYYQGDVYFMVQY